MLEIGDQIIVQVAKENREWGYNPAPDGTKGMILDFGRIANPRYGLFAGQKPGIYLNRYHAKVSLDGSATLMLSSTHFRSPDAERRENPSPEERKKKDFVGELPETPFWEGDKVDPINYAWGPVFVHKINYLENAITYELSETWPERKPVARVFFDSGLRLVERGWVWKHYHDEPIAFPDLQSEGNFHMQLGLAEQIICPETKHYGWPTLESVLKGIEDGLGHAFTASRGFFGGPLSHAVYRYNDEELGKRLADKVLSEFRK